MGFLVVSLPPLCGNVLGVPTEIERLYREHRAGLVRLVERELRDHHDAEDVVQTAFLDAQCALERGAIPRNPRAWLAAIALNAAHRLWRRRLNAEPLEEYAVHEVSGMPEIRAALASLPKEQRAAVLYRDVLGLSYGETAEQMGTSVNAVTMLLYRGRQRLRQTLGVSVGGLGVWRWWKQAGIPQVAVVKGAAAVVVAAGLATAGVVAARVVAPIGTEKTAKQAARAGTPGGAIELDATRRAGDAKPEPRRSTAEVVPSLLPSTLAVPTFSLPTLPIPTLPAVAERVTLSTPIISETVSTPTGTTATVTTPITTVAVPIP
jgi:RNA polymerase sigma-70 factor (ECF subfamily)